MPSGFPGTPFAEIYSEKVLSWAPCVAVVSFKALHERKKRLVGILFS